MGASSRDEHCHAVTPGDLDKTVGYAEALCGVRVADAGLESADRPWGVLYLPCVIGPQRSYPTRRNGHEPLKARR